MVKFSNINSYEQIIDKSIEGKSIFTVSSTGMVYLLRKPVKQ